MNFNVEFLTAAAIGQQDRSKVDGTKTTYLSCVRTVSNVANKISDLRGEILEIDPHSDTPVYYLGQASKIY